MKPLDQFNFHQTLEASRGRVLVMFTAPHCGACNMLRDALVDFHRDQPATALYEVDTQRDPGLGEEFGVFHLPALFLYLNGQYHAEIRCEALPEKIAEGVDHAVSVPAEETP